MKSPGLFGAISLIAYLGLGCQQTVGDMAVHVPDCLSMSYQQVALRRFVWAGILLCQMIRIPGQR